MFTRLGSGYGGVELTGPLNPLFTFTRYFVTLHVLFVYFGLFLSLFTLHVILSFKKIFLHHPPPSLARPTPGKETEGSGKTPAPTSFCRNSYEYH